jgi:hypothetical protein
MRRIALTTMLLAGSFASAQEGVNQTEALIKKGEQTVKAVTEARGQLEKTLASYNAIVDGKAADPKSSYKDLGKAVKDSEDRVADVTKRKDEMDAEAGSYGRIATAGKDARSEYDAFLGGLKDQITFLGHDLNPPALASLKPDAVKLNDRAKKMFEKIDSASATANASIDGMRQK